MFVSDTAARLQVARERADQRRPSRVAGLGRDVVADFLHELAEGAGLTLHVRLIEGSDTQHVLEAIFKALGAALAHACRQRS